MNTPTLTQKRAINAHTVGPIKPDMAIELTMCDHHQETAVEIMTEDGSETVAYATSDDNARLLASSYTAFDRAGRTLGIDAAELAEKIDLSKLIHAAQEYANPLCDRKAMHEKFLAVLANLPRLS